MNEPAFAGDIIRRRVVMSPLPGLGCIKWVLTHSWRCGLPIFRQLRWLIELWIKGNRVAIVGDDERVRGEVAIKDLRSGEQRSVKRGDVSGAIRTGKS